ncbi:N-acetylglucosamine-6-phosphate deacetylase [Mucilaginibacter myungsuensis]|uniref:N-acetylglucosamine-6-phosphate deacetylase n=1 Tax=Mucilaginibacter myungsuensis TaxID=649104 RepID=A0A929PX21_9SPHI|nr:N-acetylglucosamine-6-phosphate deacetylase [Mucilaginibacter myungsuensis]MBE9663408.1 N-acetylglucosamine-6-phosphate deacetylase [Mucilaginibacter myungsuensis]MDN3600144.1 N-acetylglucosamine-6-phosphate deacetylase [Mucilaginibacter myungsuensis]
MLTALHNTNIITNGETLSGKAVLIANGKIKAIVDEQALPADAQRIDLNGNFIAPGFIDLQIYGAGKHLFGSLPSTDALRGMETELFNQGCTGFLATMATNSGEVVEAGIAAAKAYRPMAKGMFLGLHLEGPFLNAKRKGAHPDQFIKKATLDQVKRWVDMADGEIKMMTVAPELQDDEVLAYMDEQGIILSSGHSDATYDEAKGFLHQPIKAITHLYNAMPQMHHREPGIIPAIFEERPYTSIVADGIHVNFAMIALAKRELGERLFLITDAVAEASEGTYQHVFTGDRFTMPDGTLSGSCLTMLTAVQNCVDHCNISLPEAVNMASLYPAQLAGLSTKGMIAEGFDADLIIFDKDFQVRSTMFNGGLTMST